MRNLNYLTQDTNPDYPTPWAYLYAQNPHLSEQLKDVKAGVLTWEVTKPYVYLCRPMTKGMREFPQKDQLRRIRYFDPAKNNEGSILREEILKNYDANLYGEVIRYLDTFLARKATAVFVDYYFPSVGVTFELIAAHCSGVPIYGLKEDKKPSAFYANMIIYVNRWEIPLQELQLV